MKKKLRTASNLLVLMKKKSVTFAKVAKTFMYDEIKICGLLKRSFRRSIARS